MKTFLLPKKQRSLYGELVSRSYIFRKITSEAKILAKKVSNRHAFMGELAVKVSQNEPNRAPVAYPTRIYRYVSELPTSYIFQ